MQNKYLIIFLLFILSLSIGCGTLYQATEQQEKQELFMNSSLKNDPENKDVKIEPNGTNLILKFYYTASIPNTADSGFGNTVYFTFKKPQDIKEGATYKIPNENIEIFNQKISFFSYEAGPAKDLSGEIKINEYNTKKLRLNILLKDKITETSIVNAINREVTFNF